MVASGFGGPIASLLVSRQAARGGDRRDLLAPSLSRPALTDFSTQQWLAGADDAAGLRVASALLASSSAIMAAAPEGESGGPRADETMAYELGAGLGMALFGLILTRSYSASIALPSGLSGAMAQQAASSIGEAVSLSQALPAGVAQALMAAARTALFGLQPGAGDSGVLLLLLAAGIWRSLAPWRNRSRRYSCNDQIHRRAPVAKGLLLTPHDRRGRYPDIQGGPPDRDATARVPPASTSLPRSAGRRGHSLHAHPGDLCT